MAYNTKRELSLRGERLLTSVDGDIDPDYVRDSNEAYQERMNAVAEELAAIRVEDDKRRDRDDADYQLHKCTGYGHRAVVKRVSPDAIQVEKLLVEATGVSDVVSSVDDGDLDLLKLTAYTMSAEQKARYRLLAGIGDAALTLALARVCLRKRMTVEQHQNMRSRVTTGAHLAARFVAVFPPGFLVIASGGAVTPRVGSTALEAAFGLLELGSGVEWVSHAAFVWEVFGDDLR
jgi:hypothetical protein